MSEPSALPAAPAAVPVPFPDPAEAALASVADDDALAAVLASSHQLLLCLAADWQATGGRLQRFERTVAGWQPVGAAWPVMLGRNGLAWGMAGVPAGAVEKALATAEKTGAAVVAKNAAESTARVTAENLPENSHAPGLAAALDPVADATTPPRKIEGDGRAPVGVFPVTAVFGYAAADSALAQALRLPYLAAHPGLQCVDDPASAHYNQVVDRATVTVDWGSAEEMRRADGRYELGAVLAYNQPPQPGRGSCIFLHVWEAPGVPTAGCTALALPAMRELALWLDAAARPLLLQWPQAEYAARRAAWGLPDL